MTEDKKIQIIIDSLRANALGDINKASHGGSKMGAFILCSCLIDAIAGFIKGSDTTRDDYKDFVRDYLNKYNPDSLYADLRCKLVHSYSEGGSYLFVDNKPHMHFKQHDGKTIINLEDFISDVDDALKQYENKIKDKKEIDLRAKAISRFDINGIIQVFQLSSFDDTPPASGVG